MRVVKIDPLRFLAGCRKKRLNQVLSVVYLSMILLCCCLLGPLFMYRYFALVCNLLCLFWLIWLSCQYMQSDWLERLF